MKKYLIIFILIIFVVFLYFFFKKQSSFLEYKLEGRTYKLLTAKNTFQWTEGLMNYRSKSELKGADGMIFIFPDKQMRTFWNMNTYLDLDVYWLENDKVIGKDFLPNILKTKEPFTISSKKEVNKVIEIVR